MLRKLFASVAAFFATTAFADGDQLCAWLGEMATEQGGTVRFTASPATDGYEEGNP